MTDVRAFADRASELTWLDALLGHTGEPAVSASVEGSAGVGEAVLAMHCGTNVQQVTRRADVAPGTILNHVSGQDELAGAVADQLKQELKVPDAEIFAGLETVEGRIRRLARELAEHYRRSEPCNRVCVRKGGRISASAYPEQRLSEAIRRLVTAALGELAADTRIELATSTLLDPGVFSGLCARGLTPKEAGEFAADLLLAWLPTTG